jgi:amino acid transporter
MSTDYSDKDKHEDMKVLHGMGYAQELSRSMSKFSNFAISFSIICILSGGINSFAQAISSVGGAGAGIGWIVGCLLSGMFALAMAQIASAFPTAGGLYHWASILGGRFWGWLTAWLNLLGLITVLGAINIGTAYFFAGTFGSNLTFLGEGGFTGSDWQVVGFVAAITILQAIFNHVGIRVTTFLTDISGYIIFLTTAVLVVACLYYAQSIDISRLWTFTNYSGAAGNETFPQSDNMGYLFLLCLLLPVYTITGYDASAHTSEETRSAATSVPKGIVSAVIWSSLVGWIMICAIMLAVPNMDEGAAQGFNVFFWTMDAILPPGLKTALYAGILIAQFLCGLATVTSASRMLFAFSRDDGLPVGSKALATVSPTYRTPVAAIWTSTVLCILYVLLALSLKVAQVDDAGNVILNEAGEPVTLSIYVIVVNSTLVFLFLSFTIPLVAGLFAYGTAKWPNPGPWAMSAGVYKLVTVLAVIGMGVILFIAVAPPNIRVLYIVLGFIALALVLWVVIENRRFEGPPTGERIAARKAAIAAAEAAVGEKA